MSRKTVNGFDKNYYIRVQRNMIERGITSQAQYADLYIYEIDTDPSMKSICECCSHEQEKIQHIMYRFHVRSRKDPNFRMVIGSTCIQQFKDIDPDELKHALLLFEKEKKEVEKRKRQDRAKARVEEYKSKYKHYLDYLDLYYRIRRFMPQELYDVYRILTKGTKIFRPEHEQILQKHMQICTEERLHFLQKDRQIQVVNYQLWMEKRKQLEKDKKWVEQLRKFAPAEITDYLNNVLQWMSYGYNLMDSDRTKLQQIEAQLQKNGTVVVPANDLHKQATVYLTEVPNNRFMRNMVQLMNRGCTLSPAQRKAVEQTLSAWEKLKPRLQTYKVNLEKLVSLQDSMSPKQKKQLQYLKACIKGAQSYGRFFHEEAEKKFADGLNKLLAELTTVPAI